jgi:hypothetical protein
MSYQVTQRLEIVFQWISWLIVGQILLAVLVWFFEPQMRAGLALYEFSPGYLVLLMVGLGLSITKLYDLFAVLLLKKQTQRMGRMQKIQQEALKNARN